MVAAAVFGGRAAVEDSATPKLQCGVWIAANCVYATWCVVLSSCEDAAGVKYVG